MSAPRVTLLGSQEKRLVDWLSGHPDGHERGAIVFFRKFDRSLAELNVSPRYVAVDLIEMSDDWILDSSQDHLRINLRKFPELYHRCEVESLELGFVHNHPNGQREFSLKDDQNERNILRGYAGANGPGVTLVSLICANGSWRARTRTGRSPDEVLDARHVAVIGERFALHLLDTTEVPSEVLKRQEAAFGGPFNRKLQSLRVVVVGAGGTGSSAATLMARSGVGELVIVDGDKLEDTNLNRVRGFRKSDIGSNKAAVLSTFINGLDLPTKVIAIEQFLHESPAAIDALSSSDVIFGCTDDVAGRDLMNQATYYYASALIDAGLTGKIDIGLNGEPCLRDHRGRVSTILPEHGKCLRCQGVVTEAKLKFEREVRRRPELADMDAKTLREEFYLTGGGERAPGVGPFTSATADMAVASLMDLIKPYRKLAPDLRSDNLWNDFVHMSIYSNQPADSPQCFCCGVGGLLLQSEGSNRLGMPALGKILSA